MPCNCSPAAAIQIVIDLRKLEIHFVGRGRSYRRGPPIDRGLTMDKAWYCSNPSEDVREVLEMLGVTEFATIAVNFTEALALFQLRV